MPLYRERIHYLLEAYISGQANSAEENEFMDWVLEAEEDSDLQSFMLDVWNEYKPKEKPANVNWDEMYSRVMQPPIVSIEPKVKRMSWVRFSAAAVILIVLAAGTYLYFIPHSSKTVVTIDSKQNDIAPPSGNKAVLTLADGTKIEIDSSGNGTLAVQGNVKVIKKSNGEISYTGSYTGEPSYNTLTVPRGSQPLSLTLSDGSKVWINVGSSLSYPTAFAGVERKVKITGEAYFEVAYKTVMPFIVQHDDIEIRVLGTHFNVNTYEDETDERITLLEGSVRIKRNSLTQVLKPGQQARISNKKINDIKIVNDVNLDEVMAWKDGKFGFGENTDISTIMRQISRWYNVEIEYQGDIDQRFWGSISKYVNVSEICSNFEGGGHIRAAGCTIYDSLEFAKSALINELEKVL